MSGVSTPAACLLLSKFVPATARLFAEFRRLRNTLPPAEARNFAECERKGLRDAELLTLVSLCACQGCRADSRGVELPSPASALQGGAVPDALSYDTNRAQRHVKAASKSSGNIQLKRSWVQTLQDSDQVESMIDAERFHTSTAVRDAKFEGVMCSALVELVCEALARTGGSARAFLPVRNLWA